MTTTKKKKSAREKRVLVASIICAGLIVAGSTFAWFTSKDEVTNRLSASAKYDVSIVEDFQPPEDWVPGQTINKDVSAVNTGNVDAFVRMWLGGQMRLLNETTPSVDATSASLGLTNDDNAVTDADKVALGLTYSKTDGSGNVTYYRTLSTVKSDNPNDPNNATAADEDTNSPAKFSEVQSVQAGGVLVYAPANAAYHWTLEQATELPVYTPVSGETPANTTTTNLAKGTVVGNSTTTQSGATKLAPASNSDSNYYGAIDASTFQPETTGLYIFRRNVEETADGIANTYEYSGYYYDATLQKYFALHTDTGANGNSDYVLPAGVINNNSSAEPSKDQVLPVTIATNVYLYTAAEQVLDVDDLTWVYDGTVGSEKFTVTYDNGTDTDNTDDIVIDIALANIGTGSEKWTAIGTTNDYKTTFYYNNDVEAGDTTTKLVDSVALSKDTTQKAYLAFDFDLDVFLESVQVTMDENGVEQITAAKEQFATAPTNGTAITAGKVEATNTGAEITSINWNKTT